MAVQIFNGGNIFIVRPFGMKLRLELHVKQNVRCVGPTKKLKLDSAKNC